MYVNKLNVQNQVLIWKNLLFGKIYLRNSHGLLSKAIFEFQKKLFGSEHIAGRSKLR